MRDSWFRWDGDLRTDDISVKQARRLYFLMTGQSYAQATPPWTISNRRPEQWIDDIASEDVGGIRVGRLAPGISLADKTGSAVLDPQTATGTTDMTLTFANATNTANEARAEVLLPPGAVCHQASLWINGTERPAAFGPQATVRRAYQAVAVVEQRDPLLVTMPVPGKLLVQCFPIPARGTMKIRLGVTFPLLPDVSDRRKLSYALPAWGAVNFAGAGKLADGWRVTDAATGKTPVLPLLLAPGAKWSEKATARRPINLIVALDGSIGMKEAFSRTVQSALQDYFDAVSSSSSMSYTGNADVPESFDTSMILVSHIAELLDFRDGQDNVPMLTRTMKARRRTIAEDSMETVVLYLHAGTPDAVSDAAPLAEAVKTLPPLASGRPRFVSLLLKPDAPDTIGDRLALQANARAISSALYPSAADAVTATVDAIVRGSDFPVLATTDPSLSAKRLAAYRDALAVWYVYNNFGAEALAAARIAAGMRLVTPLSGAVVLETRTDYEKHGLDDGTEKDAKRDADTEKKQVTKLVTPEPGTWALFAAGAATGLTALRLRRPRK